jgi:uncharacterized ferritin-like protein (DUF455 family)
LGTFLKNLLLFSVAHTEFHAVTLAIDFQDAYLYYLTNGHDRQGIAHKAIGHF